ncbi:glucokinase [Anopheles sinensis]|uniref:Glucokinase n=1 Tax=Anopheles sinensis TaxID=74873 RepID=A0A084VZ65_ANOSI|nr:glucokinase [Anopheles sinensis]
MVHAKYPDESRTRCGAMHFPSLCSENSLHGLLRARKSPEEPKRRLARADKDECDRSREWEPYIFVSRYRSGEDGGSVFPSIVPTVTIRPSSCSQAISPASVRVTV